MLEPVEDYEVSGASADDDDFYSIGVRGVGHSGRDDKAGSMGVQGSYGTVGEGWSDILAATFSRLSVNSG